MKKIIVFILILWGAQGYSNTTMVYENDKSKTDTVVNVYNTDDINGCVSWKTRYLEGLRTYVVDFTNNCNSSVEIYYDYYSTDSNKWIEGYAYRAAGKTIRGYAAGGKGLVQIVTYKFR